MSKRKPTAVFEVSYQIATPVERGRNRPLTYNQCVRREWFQSEKAAYSYLHRHVPEHSGGPTDLICGRQIQANGIVYEWSMPSGGGEYIKYTLSLCQIEITDDLDRKPLWKIEG